MQEAEVVLSVLRERGRRGLPLTQLYRQMFNKGLYLLAYGNIYSNQGAMTPGASAGASLWRSAICADTRMNQFLFGVPEHFWILRASLLVICAAQRWQWRAAGAVPGRGAGCRVRRFRGRFRDRGGKTTLGRQRRRGNGGDGDGDGDAGPRGRDRGPAGGGAGGGAGGPGGAVSLEADRAGPQ